MAVKRTVKEICPRCGQAQSSYDEVRREISHDPGHGCTQRVPGPPPFPVRHQLRDVIYERADGTQITEHGGEVIPIDAR